MGDPDFIRLVIAARKVAFEDQGADALRELDRAAEAFAELVPWEDGSIGNDGGFERSVRQAALALAHDFSVATDDEFGPHGITWAGQPSIARIRDLYPDATLDEAATASEVCRAWAELQERSADIVPIRTTEPGVG